MTTPIGDAAAMAESRELRDLLDDFTRAVIDLRQSVRLADAAHAVRKKAGLPPVKPPPPPLVRVNRTEGNPS